MILTSMIVPLISVSKHDVLRRYCQFQNGKVRVPPLGLIPTRIDLSSWHHNNQGRAETTVIFAKHTWYWMPCIGTPEFWNETTFVDDIRTSRNAAPWTEPPDLAVRGLSSNPFSMLRLVSLYMPPPCTTQRQHEVTRAEAHMWTMEGLENNLVHIHPAATPRRMSQDTWREHTQGCRT
jgi:hypothetical protein